MDLECALGVVLLCAAPGVIGLRKGGEILVGILRFDSGILNLISKHVI